ncbi:MAG: B12-binding domain-containing radical SAM protein [Deltaproteobacteria bacterium]|nr:B12-binding domain-containing radical SAM protein [Deltaproteobacteria bacterium]
MKVQFVYPSFERHAQSHPELLECVPCNEYLGGPSLGIASIAAVTPPDVQVAFHDDRVKPLTLDVEADLYALSFFTPAATRALELADMLRAAGRKVVAGGIFPTMMPEVAGAHFDSIVVGEGEGVWNALLSDFGKGALKPRYEQTEPFDLEKLPPPRVDLYVEAESAALHPDDYPLQISRGCPLNCDACVVPYSMGKKVRLVPREVSKTALSDLAKAGKLAAITEDTSFFAFSGARRHLRTFLADLKNDPRPRGQKISYLGCSMPMILSLDPTLIQEISDAGIDRFYLVCGFDPITRNAFGKGDPDAMDRAIRSVQRCHEFGIEPYTSLLVGNETDDEGVFDRILEFTVKAKVPKTEFAIFTPYPGTPSWHQLEGEGRIFDKAWKHYNDANVVFKPKQMSAERLLDGYLTLWREFYKDKLHLAEMEQGQRTIQF